MLFRSGLVLQKKTRPLFYGAVAAVAVNVSLNFALIPPLGLMGAALATPLSMLVYLGWAYAAARPFATWRFPLASLARSATAAALGAFAATQCEPAGGWRPLAVMIVAAVGLPVYAVTLFLLGERRGGRRRTEIEVA